MPSNILSVTNIAVGNEFSQRRDLTKLYFPPKSRYHPSCYKTLKYFSSKSDTHHVLHLLLLRDIIVSSVGVRFFYKTSDSFERYLSKCIWYLAVSSCRTEFKVLSKHE